MIMADDKKICFVITPIGNDNTEIRRHIDGIIDQAIIPALNEKYKVEVAHRKYEIGSITDRIISSIWSADLVIANLTTLNPNVMFELAIRYSFAKPAIVIAEQGTRLPFDVNAENTVFYINDPAGAADLKEAIIKFESNIDFTKKEYGPIFSALRTASFYENIENSSGTEEDDLKKYIVSRFDELERKMELHSKRITNINPSPDLLDAIKSQYSSMELEEIMKDFMNKEMLKSRNVIKRER